MRLSLASKVLFAVVLAAATAMPVAESFALPLGGHVLSPPKRYDRAPKNLVGRYVVPDVGRYCKRQFGLVGCSWITTKGECYIFIKAGLPKGLAAATLRHERAHCNGWRH